MKLVFASGAGASAQSVFFNPILANIAVLGGKGSKPGINPNKTFKFSIKTASRIHNGRYWKATCW